MGFNKRYLPELDKLKKMRESFSSDSDFLYNVIGKSCVLIGPSDSMDYLNYIRKEIENGAEKN